MRALRPGGLLAVLLVAACGSQTSDPPVSEATTAASTTSVLVTEPSTVASQPSTPATATPSSAAESTTPTSTAEESPPTTSTTAMPLSGPVVLRGDGLGDARFGDPMLDVEPWLREQLGGPSGESVARTPFARSQWYEARDFLRTLTFGVGGASGPSGSEGSVTVTFSDLSDVRDDGVVHLAGWSTESGQPFATPAGLTVGDTTTELLDLFPNVALGLTDPYGSPGWFEITAASTGEAGIRGLAGRGDRVIRLEAGVDSRRREDIPAQAPAPPGPVVPDLDLRPDGLGSTQFGEPARDLLMTLTERFGHPAEETNVRARQGETLRYASPLGYFPEAELRLLTWHDPRLTILVADGDVYSDVPSEIALVLWATPSSRLRFTGGLGVDSTLAEFEAAYANVTVGIVEECGGTYHPTDFVVDNESGTIAGIITWDWISDVQLALNQRGADLVVDGEYGSRTTAAVEAFQTQAAISSDAPWDRDGSIGPLTLDALGISAPPTAIVTGLRAGDNGSC